MVKYYIQKIVNVRKVKKKKEYQVKWKNYAHKYNTWEPMSRLIEDGQEKFIYEYENQMKIKKKEIKPSSVKKKAIPKRVRKAVWEKYAGKVWQTKCNVTWCNNTLVSLGSWHVGHNISEAKGGEFSIDNFRPICQQCNTSMGTTSIDEFSRTYSSSKDFYDQKNFPNMKRKYPVIDGKCTCKGFQYRGHCRHMK